ncbi:hypothetical protein JG687_00006663 [Phytophthora cactorum]|uniref:Uncharacterized protein n=1 Tax=Phytophthora cactorum TaxID=29920 RepID=A0A8T1UHB7_9STRA|nr:hypothetical protein JG687_00006663 [Phytophthora cactorum]
MKRPGEEYSRGDQHSPTVPTRHIRSAILRTKDFRLTELTDTMCNTRPSSLKIPRLCAESSSDADVWTHTILKSR